VEGAVDVSPVARCQSSREMRNRTCRRRGPSTAGWSKSSQGSCVIPSRVITFRDRVFAAVVKETISLATVEAAADGWCVQPPAQPSSTAAGRRTDCQQRQL